jgi:hypothetical protein
MKRISGYCVVVVFLLMTSTNPTVESHRSFPVTPQPKADGGVATLYALDPLAHTFCFRDGQYGSIFQHDEVRNRCSDLEFNSYNAGNFTVGVEGGRVGTIIDLGSASELRQKYGYSESSVSRGVGFASIRRQDGKLVILKNVRPQTTQELKEATELFKEGTSKATAPVKLGHIYLVRLTDKHEKSFELLAKIVVIAYTANESVTIRLQLL